MTDIMDPRTDAAAGGGDKQLVAMFEDYGKAMAARDALEAAGVSRSRIEIVDRSSLPGAQPQEGYVRRPEDVEYETGVWGSIKRFFVPDDDAHAYAEGVRRGHSMLVVRVDAADQDKVFSLLESQNPVDVETHAADWRREGWSGADAGQAEWERERAASAATPATPAPPTAGPAGPQARSEDAIPVYEERLRVGKREVGRGSVRVRSYVVEDPVERDVSLREERVELERRPADPIATEKDVTTEPFKERSIEVTARGEEPVVSKEARVKEEVVVHKKPVERTETVKDAVRRTEVEVEDDRARAPEAPGPSGIRKP